MREGEVVFWKCFVMVGEVNTDPQYAILLLYDDWVCQPFRILHFVDGTCVKRSVDLFIDGLRSLGPSFCFFWRIGLNVGWTLSSCVVMMGSITFMSELGQANVETLSLKNETILSFVSSGRWAPTRTVLAWSLSSMATSRISSLKG